MRASGGGKTWGIRDWLTLAIPAQVISFSGSSTKNAANLQFRYAERR